MAKAIKVSGLDQVKGRLIKNISRGFKQRVGIAQALVHDPLVLILDEPTIGLDPAQIIEIRSLIKSLKGEHTIILSTHILAEVTQTCDGVVIINEGRLMASGSLEELTASFRKKDGGDRQGPEGHPGCRGRDPENRRRGKSQPRERRAAGRMAAGTATFATRSPASSSTSSSAFSKCGPWP